MYVPASVCPLIVADFRGYRQLPANCHGWQFVNRRHLLEQPAYPGVHGSRRSTGSPNVCPVGTLWSEISSYSYPTAQEPHRPLLRLCQHVRLHLVLPYVDGTSNYIPVVPERC